MTEEEKKFEQYADEQIALEKEKSETDNKSKNNTKSKKKRGFIIPIVAIILVVSSGIMCFLFKGKNKNKNKDNDFKEKYSNSNIDELDNKSLDDLGKSIEFGENTQNQYGNVTGNVDLGSVVIGKDGTYYVDENARNRAENSSNNNSNNNSTTQSDNTTGYIIVDENGKTIAQGEGNNIPAGYAWDSGRGEYVPTDQVGKYVYSEYNIYYKSTGTLVISKGDLVEKTRYEEILSNSKYTTTKPVISEPQPTETQPTESQPIETQPTESSNNSNYNGSYTDSYGNVWASYQDYLNGIANPDDIYYNSTDGMLHCDGKNKDNANSVIETEPSLSEHSFQKSFKL